MAMTSYLQVTGTNQGAIEGDCTQPDTKTPFLFMNLNMKSKSPEIV